MIISLTNRWVIKLQQRPRIGGFAIFVFGAAPVLAEQGSLGVLIAGQMGTDEEGRTIILINPRSILVVAEGNVSVLGGHPIVQVLFPRILETGLTQVIRAEHPVHHHGGFHQGPETEHLVTGAFVTIAVRRIPFHQEIHLLLHLFQQEAGLQSLFIGNRQQGGHHAAQPIPPVIGLRIALPVTHTGERNGQLLESQIVQPPRMGQNLLRHLRPQIGWQVVVGGVVKHRHYHHVAGRTHAGVQFMAVGPIRRFEHRVEDINDRLLGRGIVTEGVGIRQLCDVAIARRQRRRVTGRQYFAQIRSELEALPARDHAFRRLLEDRIAGNHFFKVVNFIVGK